MRFILLSVAAVIAVFAGIAALQLSNKSIAPPPIPQQEKQQAVTTVDILVARVPIQVGTLVTQAMLDTQPWPENLVLKDFIISGGAGANIVGKITRAPLLAREPFTNSKLANTNEAGFLAATLPAGQRAITIATDAVSGVAGFVYPGDHVDVLLIHNIPEQIKVATPTDARVAATSDRPAHSETLVANAQVLAINLREANSREENPTGANLAPIAPSSITLQVNAVDAENIKLAEKVGTLSLSLRSVMDADNLVVTPPTDLAALTHVHISEPVQAEDNSVKVTRR